MLRTACSLLVVCLLGCPFNRSVEARAKEPSSSFESFDCLDSARRYTETSPARRTSMARGRWTLLFIVGFGVCPLIAPGTAPEAPPVPALDVPPSPARTTPAAPSRVMPDVPATTRPSRPIVPSRSITSAAPLVQPPTAFVFVAALSEAPLAPSAPFARSAPFAPGALVTAQAPFAPSAPRAPDAPLAPGAPSPLRATRPASLVPLYASFATLQGLDYASTRSALADGGSEANPLMRSIVENPTAFIAVKAAATAGVILVGEKMWKKNRVGAVLFVAGANAAMAVVVGRNYAVR
jgi:Domain of unknown function (DUF5658)